MSVRLARNSLPPDHRGTHEKACAASSFTRFNARTIDRPCARCARTEFGARLPISKRNALIRHEKKFALTILVRALRSPTARARCAGTHQAVVGIE
ncbi:MAG: hypothetical protein ACXWVG_15360 [Telluria sp.]